MLTALRGINKRGYGIRSVLVFWFVIVFMSGCVESLPKADPEPVTLRVVAGGGFALDGDYVRSLMPLFNERYPHITIEFTPPLAPDPEKGCGNSDYCSRVDEVDTFQVDFSQAWEYEQRGYLLDLSGFIEEDDIFDTVDFLPGTLEAYRIGGRQIAVPLGMTFDVIVYNRELFDHYGVAYPAADWTWDEFLKKAQALTHSSQDVWGYGASGGWFTWLASNGGALVDYTKDPPRTQFDDPLVIETLAWYADLIHAHRVAPTEAEARERISQGDNRYSIMQVGVMKEQIAMWDYRAQGRKTIAASNLYWPERWAMVPYPQTARSVARIDVSGYGISTACKHPEAAWAWVSFLSQQPPKPAALALPVRRSILTSEAYVNAQGEDIVELALNVTKGPVTPIGCRQNCTFDPIAAGAGPILSQTTRSVLAGEEDAASALAAAQQEVERAIGK